MRHYIILIILCLAATSCTSNRSSNNSTDTAEIIEAAFSSRKLLCEISLKYDTIQIIKNGIYNEAFPAKVNELAVSYVPDTGSNKSKNRRWQPKEQINENLRFELQKLDISGDSAEVEIYYFNLVADYKFRLKKLKRGWSVTEVHVGLE